MKFIPLFSVVLAFLFFLLFLKVIPYRAWVYSNNCTDSMAPEITCNCIGIMKTVDKADQLQNGDIIRFIRQYDGYLIVHRTIQPCLIEENYFYNSNGTSMRSVIYNRGWITKGDNATMEDGCIPYNNIQQKLVWFRCLGG